MFSDTQPTYNDHVLYMISTSEYNAGSYCAISIATQFHIAGLSGCYFTILYFLRCWVPSSSLDLAKCNLDKTKDLISATVGLETKIYTQE